VWSRSKAPTQDEKRKENTPSPPDQDSAGDRKIPNQERKGRIAQEPDSSDAPAQSVPPNESPGSKTTESSSKLPVGPPLDDSQEEEPVSLKPVSKPTPAPEHEEPETVTLKPALEPAPAPEKEEPEAVTLKPVPEPALAPEKEEPEAVTLKFVPKPTPVPETEEVVPVVSSNKGDLNPSPSGADWIGTAPPIPGGDVDSSGRLYTPGGGGMKKTSSIRYLSFCSVDDSVDPKLLGIISRCYPLIEFAVLIRQDMAGQPRYASPAWIQKLALVQAKGGGKMRLAAHLSGSFATEVLSGDDGILKRLTEMKFHRVQLNATSINGVNTYQLGKYVEAFLSVAAKHPELEIALQRNEETRPLWEGVLAAGNLPSNISMLFDESKGMGIVPESWPTAPAQYRVGYAGGIGLGGRGMTKKALKRILKVGNGQSVWVSMESSMRCTKNGKDVFDIDKCYEVIDVAHECNIHLHPGFIA
jgi:hypothetical protein